MGAFWYKGLWSTPPGGEETKINNSTGAEDVAQRNKKYSSAPQMSIDPGKQYTATVTTSLGAFKIDLLAQDAPVTVNNFVFLAREGFYNNIIFHRIIKTL